MNPIRQATPLTGAFILVGVGLLGAGIFQGLEVRAFVRAAQTVPGRVTDLDHRSGSKGGGYVTIFTFADASGQRQTSRTSWASNPPTHQVGDEVVVLYPPGDPEAARIRAFRTLWFGPTLLGGFGLAFSSMGAFGFVAVRRTYGPSRVRDSN
jgi:hypothetical protein